MAADARQQSGLRWGKASRAQVILRVGGVYADLDTECRRPMSDLILPRDTLVGCWENEFARPRDAEARHYVRNRQVWERHVPPWPPSRKLVGGHASRAIADVQVSSIAPRTGRLFEHLIRRAL